MSQMGQLLSVAAASQMCGNDVLSGDFNIKVEPVEFPPAPVTRMGLSQDLAAVAEEKEEKPVEKKRKKKTFIDSDSD